ncbi:hypothetical protein ACHAQJ_002966 [Trichoderma viride]
MDSTSNLTLIDTLPALSAVIDSIKYLPTEPPSLYVDLEGINLCRHGTISILQLYIHPTRRAYLIDVLALQDKCFSTPGESGLTLKDILESNTIPKVFFDVRNDSDALFSHYQIRLAGILDLQLMELATRSSLRRFVKGLAKCIEFDAPLSARERLEWMQIKEKGTKLFKPEQGGSYEVFNERPLRADILAYCAQDVYILPRLWAFYNSKMTAVWKQRVIETSQERVRLSQMRSYNGKGKDKALAPAGWHLYMY